MKNLPPLEESIIEDIEDDDYEDYLYDTDVTLCDICNQDSYDCDTLGFCPKEGYYEKHTTEKRIAIAYDNSPSERSRSRKQRPLEIITGQTHY